MEHYFSETPSIKSKNREIKYKINNEIFEFITDNGVFSKTRVDFGTDLMLREFIKENKNGKFSNKEEFDILDIGCGYGVVSVVIKYFYKKSNLTLSDINERAIELSIKNLKKYEIEEYSAVKSFVFDNINEKFDVILSNPPIRAGKKTIFEIYEKSFEHLNKNGAFYCVIQTKHGAKSTQKKLEEVFSNCETIAIDGGYRIYKAIKKF
ncbi:MAG: class I SAM-dependent methyltransferase [Leptotrichiaceae bacterium]|nr:class I SAM-dependent methyltransferase [Leptotrichiaceae bacterium]MBP7100682.1 class I SAM-dependent methyltransferase [Leptotrichiaceae bacterium]MBP7725626.1 class I SAM-dependent methyltransferase [Leptotrichiaceae bacterium]MBP9629428.1 class I SAM-dependent methyltransferase [Leptotrichiaceae bacterium]